MGDDVEAFAQLGAMGMIGGVEIDGGVAGQASGGERTPGQWRNFLGKAQVESAIEQVIEPDQTDFHLVGNERLVEEGLEGAKLGGREIADSEPARFALMTERLEGARDFFGMRQQVVAVELEQIEGVHAQSAQRSLAGLDDVLRGVIVAVRAVGVGFAFAADAAFRGEGYLIAHAGDLVEHFAEERFGVPVAIDVGVIEEGESLFEGGEDGFAGDGFAFGGNLAGFPGAAEAPASVGEAAWMEGAFSEGDRFHDVAEDAVGSIAER